MTYEKFAEQVAALGYLVKISNDGIVTVKNHSGMWLATIYGSRIYDFNTWIVVGDDWGNESQRVLVMKYIVQLSSTIRKKRGRIPRQFVKQAKA